ncbi:aminotransferase class I/II-fold pyridoxal phosphate-dependent enzyme [Alcaligenaceae bacterium SJ-26]|nr:aminotransferase class I/II-fold pyridoxal phosphate-dependent enzyme [Alcaligenaceae bacterium SJ-26]
MIVSKLPDIGTTIFTTMSSLAQETGAINLGQGFPDFEPDPALLELVSTAMQQGFNQYPAMPGYLPLRRIIAGKVQETYGRAYDPDTEITVTSGATQALMTAILASVHPGDEVIVIEPCYDAYAPAIRLAGGSPVYVPMQAPTEASPGYSIDWDRVRGAITSKTRLLIVNSPHNPTGSILSAHDLDALEDIVARHDLLLLSDEVYEHLVFDGLVHQSVARRPALAERAFIVSSFGKTFHVTGWKVGYCCAPVALMREFRKVHQFMVFTVSSPFQVALAGFLAHPEHYLGLPAFFKAKRDLLAAGLASTRLKVLPAPGTYFMLADYSEISDLSEADFSIWLTRTFGVAVIPVSAFYADPSAAESNHRLVRFCFAKKEATLQEAVLRLTDL